MKYLSIILLCVIFSCHTKDKNQSAKANNTDTTNCYHSDEQYHPGRRIWKIEKADTSIHSSSSVAPVIHVNNKGIIDSIVSDGGCCEVGPYLHLPNDSSKTDTTKMLEGYTKVGEVQDITWDSVSFSGNQIAVLPLNIRESQNLTVDSRSVSMGDVHGYEILRDTSKTKKEKGALATHNGSVYYYNGNSWFILFGN